MQLLAAGATVVATVRSVKSSPELQELHAQHGDRLTVVAMDVGDFASIKVWCCHSQGDAQICKPAKII